MPIYEFECGSCHEITEMITSHLVAHIKCSHCGQPARRVMSAGNFRITGYSARNGYNVPAFSDVIGPDGKEKKKWGRD